LKKRQEIPFPGPRQLDGWLNLAFYPDSKRMAFVSQKRRVEIWDILAGERAFTIGEPGQVAGHHLALTSDGRWLAVDNANSAATLWDAISGKPLIRLPDERSAIWGLAWSPDRQRLAVGLSDGGVVIWKLPEIRAQLARIGLDWQDAPATAPSSPATPQEIAEGYFSQGTALSAVRPQAAELAFRKGRPDEAAPVDDAIAPPQLGTPLPGAFVPNGRQGAAMSERLHFWDFAWSPVPGASYYEFQMMSPAGDTPTKTLSVKPSHRIARGASVIDRMRSGWHWKVRAWVNGAWSRWSEERSFHVAPVALDKPVPPTK
jgi:hypothetical protein